MHKTLIVVDSGVEIESFVSSHHHVIYFEQYLKDYPKRHEGKVRIINLCDTQTYLSAGYYCSLLAEARHHTVLPSVKIINALRNLLPRAHSDSALVYNAGDFPEKDFQTGDSHLLMFGKGSNEALKKVGNDVFRQFSAPLIRLQVLRDNQLLRFQVLQASFSELTPSDRTIFMAQLEDFTKTVWRLNERKKQLRWDMCILVNPAEKLPPSNKEAITRFVKAAALHGIEAHVMTAENIKDIAAYDALFIRETTAIDHHTYRLATTAEKQGLVVIDDSSSILRCCNKVYLHDAFDYKKVPSLVTRILVDQDEKTLNELEADFGYPIVLKMPEGSFSVGVYKAANRKELAERVNALFKESALVLAQQYLYTEFDWRVGVLNQRAIYACRYKMARNHWQIYNHGASRFTTGGFETLPTFEVPRPVLQAALQAAKVVGDGLYGVDLKEANGQAFVIEVNDNPSIDHKVEDAYLGDELYMQVMAEFQRRLEHRGRAS